LGFGSLEAGICGVLIIKDQHRDQVQHADVDLQVLQRLQNAVHPVAAEHFGAFYSSELGGIVTDPALMLVHMDDHMVHRGHGECCPGQVEQFAASSVPGKHGTCVAT
jgi:hypothetical protein